MTDRKSRVGLAHGENRRENVRVALERVRDEIVPRLAEPLLIKPNLLSSDNQLCCTHPDAVRGVLDFLRSLDRAPRRIQIAEGANEKESGEAYRNYGYPALQDEYPEFTFGLIDLHQETRWQPVRIVRADGSDYMVHVPQTVLDAGCRLSLAVAKTHDVDVVTLAYKNMVMGTLRKEDRVKMHGFNTHADRRLPDEARCLNENLIRLTPWLTPEIGVVDGTVGIQGNGPGGKDVVPLGVVAAGVDVFAVDATITRAMGFDPLAVGLFVYAEQLALGCASQDRIDVLGPPVASVARSFKPHEKTYLMYQWQGDTPAAQLLPA